MNKYQSFVRQVQSWRRFNLLGKTLELSFVNAKYTKQAKKDVRQAEDENEETDKEMEEHFAYSVWESIKLGLPF